MTSHVLPICLAIAGYFVFSAAVGSMSRPSVKQETEFYGWLYRFLQRLAANADRLIQAEYPRIANLAHGDAQDSTTK